eukprot:1157592-Pelagomonas_calceolata.AAC.1
MNTASLPACGCRQEVLLNGSCNKPHSPAWQTQFGGWNRRGFLLPAAGKSGCNEDKRSPQTLRSNSLSEASKDFGWLMHLIPLPDRQAVACLTYLLKRARISGWLRTWSAGWYLDAYLWYTSAAGSDGDNWRVYKEDRCRSIGNTVYKLMETEWEQAICPHRRQTHALKLRQILNSICLIIFPFI